MAHNPFIFKQIVKTLTQSIDYVDATYEISEKISESNTFIEATDKIKDKIEDKTGYHINRHYEKKIAYKNYPRANDPKVLARAEYYKQHEKEILDEMEKDNLRIEQEKYAGLIPAIIFSALILYGLISIIVEALSI